VQSHRSGVSSLNRLACPTKRMSQNVLAVMPCRLGIHRMLFIHPQLCHAPARHHVPSDDLIFALHLRSKLLQKCTWLAGSKCMPFCARSAPEELCSAAHSAERPSVLSRHLLTPWASHPPAWHILSFTISTCCTVSK